MITHRALVRLLAGVSSHVNHEHVLRFEWFFLPRAVLPSANEALFVGVNVVVVDVLDQVVL